MKKIFLCADTLSKQELSVLSRYADSVVVMPRWDEIPGGIGYHPDMLGFALGNRLWLNREYYSANVDFFDSLGAELCLCSEQYGRYPDDVRFNAFAIGDLLFGRADSLCSELKSAFGSVCNLKQGYAKCSSAVFDGNVITADVGIAAAAKKAGADVLLIEPGFIELAGYDYGFIGGALVCADDHSLISFGDITTHPQGSEIVRFANDRGFEIVSSCAGTLCDHGGLLVLDI